MKVVLFCGGFGTRLREHSDTIPKSLVNIGYRPIVWHLMRYYAHFGHTDFVLCLGYRGDLVREYFLKYDECMSNDFVMSEGGRRLEPLSSDIQDWKITFVDTGLHTNLGERLSRVRRFVDGEEMFLANYSDGLSDLPLNEFIQDVKARDVTAGFVGVRPSQSFHAVKTDSAGLVTELADVRESSYWINGGFFCFKAEIFDHIQPGEELVVQPFARLASNRDLWCYKYPGFWAAMDTFKDKITLDRMEAQGNCPWMVWSR